MYFLCCFLSNLAGDAQLFLKSLYLSFHAHHRQFGGGLRTPPGALKRTVKISVQVKKLLGDFLKKFEVFDALVRSPINRVVSSPILLGMHNFFWNIFVYHFYFLTFWMSECPETCAVKTTQARKVLTRRRNAWLKRQRRRRRWSLQAL